MSLATVVPRYRSKYEHKWDLINRAFSELAAGICEESPPNENRNAANFTQADDKDMLIADHQLTQYLISKAEQCLLKDEMLPMKRLLS